MAFSNESEARSDPSSLNQRTYSPAAHAGTNHQVNESDAARGNIGQLSVIVTLLPAMHKVAGLESPTDRSDQRGT